MSRMNWRVLVHTATVRTTSFLLGRTVSYVLMGLHTQVVQFRQPHKKFAVRENVRCVNEMMMADNSIMSTSYISPSGLATTNEISYKVQEIYKLILVKLWRNIYRSNLKLSILAALCRNFKNFFLKF